MSPDRNHVALGKETGKIEVWKFHSLDLVVKITQTAEITNIDWSKGSKALQATSIDHKLASWDANKGTMKDIRDETWVTWTCLYGWPVQGIMYKQNVLNTTCSRSIKMHHNYYLLAVGDEVGNLRMYRYPCTLPAMTYLKEKGHSSDISCLKFLDVDNYILT